MTSVYNYTRSKTTRPTRQNASSNHKPTIVKQRSVRSSKKRKPAEAVYPLLQYHPNCTAGCKEINKKKSDKDIAIANDYYREQVKMFPDIDDQCSYIKMCKDLGTHYGSVEDPCTGRTSWYIFPLTPERESEYILCPNCFRKQLKLLNSDRWKQAIYPYDSIDMAPMSSDSETSISELFNVLKFVQLRKVQNNCAVVVSSSYLKHYQNQIILQSPKLVKSSNCREGIMVYSERGLVNNKPVSFNKDFSVTASESVVIAVKKVELDECLKRENKSQQYTYEGCDCTDDNSLVILSATSTRTDQHNEFKPQSCDLTLFQEFKNNILPPNGIDHHGSEGWYFAEGGTATYTEESIGQYSTKPHDPNSSSYKDFQSKIQGCKNAVKNAITSLDSQAQFNIVEQGSSSTLKNRECVTVLNKLTSPFRDPIDLSPCYNYGIYPSMNVNVNAGTRKFHIENDQGYTLIVSLFQSIDEHAVFCFKLNPHCILSVPLTGGVNILFNARLLTHRQNNTSVKNAKGPHFWNIGCYANRRYNNHTFTSIHKALSCLFSNLDKVFSN